MKKNLQKISFFLLIALNPLFLTACSAPGNRVEFKYHSKIASGETISLKFYVYFTDEHTKKRGEMRRDQYIHALNLMFTTYDKKQLTDSRIHSILKKSSKHIFYQEVDDVKVLSVKFGKKK